MNWYQIFYWVTVADGVKSFFDVFSNVFTWGAIITFCIFIILLFISLEGYTYKNEDEKKSEHYWMKLFRNFTIWLSILSTITWAGYVFTPSKKDAMVIIAGGAVGQFITSDTSAKQIPAEVMGLLRNKIREMNEVNLFDQTKDTLAEMSKEQLIEMIKNKK